MGVFKPIWMKKELNDRQLVRAEAELAKLSQEELRKVALEAPDVSVNRAAVEKMTDQSILASVAENAADWGTREAAVNKVSSPDVLSRIAENDVNWSVRRAAVCNAYLLDIEILSRVHDNDDEFQVRIAAGDRLLEIVDKMADQQMLAQLVINDRYKFIANAAMKQLTDQSFLAEIATGASNPWIRKAAVIKITDQEILANISLNDASDTVRYAAMRKRCAYIDKISDQRELAELAKNGSDIVIRKAAMEKLTDKDIIAQIIKQAPQQDLSELFKTFKSVEAAKRMDETQAFDALKMYNHSLPDDVVRVLLLPLDKDKLFILLTEKTMHRALILERLHILANEDLSVERQLMIDAYKKLLGIDLPMQLSKSEHERARALLSALEQENPYAVINVLPHDEDTINTLVYMLKHKGFFKSYGCSAVNDLGITIYMILKELYKNEKELRKSILRKKLNRLNTEHIDVGNINNTCHSDHAPFQFVF